MDAGVNPFAFLAPVASDKTVNHETGRRAVDIVGRQEARSEEEIILAVAST